MAAGWGYSSTDTTNAIETAITTTASTSIRYFFTSVDPREDWFAAELRETRRQASLEGQRPLERVDGESQYVPPAWRRCMQPPGRFAFYQGAF